MMDILDRLLKRMLQPDKRLGLPIRVMTPEERQIRKLEREAKEQEDRLRSVELLEREISIVQRRPYGLKLKPHRKHP